MMSTSTYIQRVGLALVLCLGLFYLVPAGMAQGDFTAQDDASDSAYGSRWNPTWVDGANGGFGFEAWEIVETGGNYLGTYSGNPADKGIAGMDSRAWGMYCHSEGESVTARRPFSEAMAVGEVLSFQWGFNLGSGTGGSKGFRVLSGGAALVTVTNGAGDEIYVNGADSGFEEGVNAMTWSFAVESESVLAVTANGRDGVGSYSDEFAIAGAPDAVEFFMTRQGDNDNAREPFYNNLQIAAAEGESGDPEEGETILFVARTPEWAENDSFTPGIWGPFDGGFWDDYVMTWNASCDWWEVEIEVEDASALIEYQWRIQRWGETVYQKAFENHDGNPTFTTGTGEIWIDGSRDNYVWRGNDFYLPQEMIADGPIAAEVVLGDLVQEHDGAGRAVSVTTDPPGLSVSVTYDGGAELPVAAGSYAVSAVVEDCFYAGSASATLVIEAAEEGGLAVTWPVASGLELGQALGESVLSGGMAKDADDQTVAGLFEWVDGAFVPGAGTSGQAVRFVPEGASGYSAVTGLVSVTVTAPGGAVSGIYINEVQSSNGVTIEDEDGDTPDWIELYNASGEAIHLEGWGLSDNESSPFKWVFGDVTIGAGEYLVVFASSKNRPAVTNGNRLHTSYGVSSDGEEVVLTEPGGVRVDFVPPMWIPRDYSLGRYPDGTGDLWFFKDPTPGEPNRNDGYLTGLPAVEFSVPGGFYESAVSVELSTVEPGATIRYTLDGSEPTESSPEYAGALSIGARVEGNDLSTIQTTEGLGGEDDWEMPDGSVFKFHTLRARIFKDGSPGPHVTQSYIVTPSGAERYTLPVVSIATDKANLFGHDIGIYTPENGNMWQKGAAWERTGTIEFFEADGSLAFSGNVGLRLHGNTTRSRPRKAIRVYARGPGKFRYQLFDDLNLATFETFILRNGGNDWGQTLARDMFGQSLIGNSNIDRQYGRYVIVFLNGEYWGVHDLRERLDTGYIDNHYGLSELDYVQVKIVSGLEGYNDDVPMFDKGNREWEWDYSNLWAYVKSHDLREPANYAAVTDWMDVDNFADFYQAHIFVGNSDWPGNNLRAWRALEQIRGPGAPYSLDGRWRHMIYDMDFAFALDCDYVPGNESYGTNERHYGLPEQFNMMAFAQNADWNGAIWANQPDATLMYRKLMENDGFRKHFVLRFSDQLNTTYSQNWTTSRWAQMTAELAPEVDEHVARWRKPSDWAGRTERVSHFAHHRTAAVWTHVQDVLKLGRRYPLTVDLNDAHGFVQLNTVELADTTTGFGGYPWTGTYFTNYPVTLTAVGKPGYEFAEWRAKRDTVSLIAADSGANYAYWGDQSNQGTGFGGWMLSNSGSGGHFVDHGGQWGMWANNGGEAVAVRPLSASLAVGQTFAFRMQNRWVDYGGSVGVDLRNAQGDARWYITLSGGQPGYEIAGQPNALPYTTAAIDVELTLTGANTYSAKITAGGDEPITLTGSLQGSGDIQQFRAYNSNAGETSNRDFFVNDLRVFTTAEGVKATYSTDETIEVSLSGASEFEAIFEEAYLPDYKLIHYWNFNDAGALLAPSLSLVTGAGLEIDPADETEIVAGTGGDFFGENARLGDEPLSHLRVNNPVGAVLDAALPTSGFEDIRVKFEVRRSGKGAGTLPVTYTLDGETFALLTTLTTYDAVPRLVTLDLSELAGAADNPEFALRIDFEQGGGGLAGNVRFDNWTVEGTVREGINLPPAVVSPIGHQSLREGGGAAQVDLSTVFLDPESDALSFGAVSGEPDIVSVGLSGSDVTLTPQKRGGAWITVTAEDAENMPVATSFYVLVNPTAHVLEDGAFSFGEWDSQEPADSYPDHMLFLQSAKNDPELNDALLYAYHIPAADASVPEDAEYPYAATARTRINGLGEDGISFINTGRGRDLGAALVALDTRAVSVAPVSWLAGTILPNSRIYAMRLQYRVGVTGDFTDVLDGDGDPVEYMRNETAEHTELLGPVNLPEEALGEEYVQVLWRYYYVSGESGARAQLRLDDILVASSEAEPAVAIEFATQPRPYALSGVALPAFTVRAVDGNGVTDVNFTGEISVALDSGSGMLSGTLSVSAEEGVATFDDVMVTGSGVHVLEATCGSFDAVQSSSFLVDADPIFLPGGTAAWNSDDNWTSAFYPDGVGARAKIFGPAAARNVDVNTPITVGTLTVDNGDSTVRNRIRGEVAGNSLTFAALGSSEATLTVDGTAEGFVEFEVVGGVVLDSDLRITVNNIVGDPSYGALRLRQGWSGTGGVIKDGAGIASFTGVDKLFSGAIVIEQGVLAISQPSTPVNTSGITVQEGGQLRLTSANDENGARIYDFGGPINLASMGRTGVAEGENLGVLGAIRYEPGSPDNRAVVTTPVALAADAGIHVATLGNILELVEGLSGTNNLVKSGGGTLIVAAGTDEFSGNLNVNTGSVQLDAACLDGEVTLQADTWLEGAGCVGAVNGNGLGTVSPGPGAAILAAQSVNLVNYRFDFATATAGALDASGNDLLRLTGPTPFTTALSSSEKVELFLDVAELQAGDVFAGGFFTDVADDFLAAVTDANWLFYVRDAMGEMMHDGQNYSLVSQPDLFAISTEPYEADFGAGVVTGRILKLAYDAAPQPAGFAAWQQDMFTPEELADAEVSGPLADPDNSGIQNLLRYALGLGRDDDDDGLSPSAGISQDEPPVALLRHRQLMNRAEPPLDIEYILEYVVDIEVPEWEEAVLDQDLIFRSATATGDGLTEFVEYEVPVATLQPQRFFRLKVRLIQ